MIKRIIFLCSILALMAFGFSGTALAETYTYDITGRLTSVTYDDGSSIAEKQKGTKGGNGCSRNPGDQLLILCMRADPKPGDDIVLS